MADSVPSTLRTTRLVLRDWNDDDLEPFAALNADPEVMRFFPAPLDRARSDAFAHRIRTRLHEGRVGAVGRRGGRRRHPISSPVAGVPAGARSVSGPPKGLGG